MAQEQRIQSKIMQYLKKEGIYAFKTITLGRKGIPDIIACVNGRFVAIEVKQPGGRLTELQSWNIKQINDNHGIAFAAYSLDDVKKRIEPMLLEGRQYDSSGV